MKPGISTHLFAYYQLNRRHLELIREYGFSRIEMWGMRPHVDWYNPKQVEKVAKEVKELGIKTATFHLPFYSIFGAPDFRWVYFNHPDPEVRHQALSMARHIVDQCALFECDVVVLHGNGAPGPDFAEANDRYRRTLDVFLPYCEKRGVRIAIENVMTRLSDTTTLRKLVDDYDSDYLWLCLDTGHANIVESMPEAVAICGDRLITTHIADNFGKNDDHIAPFTGTIDWEATYRAFRTHCPNLNDFMFELMYPIVNDDSDPSAFRKPLEQCVFAWEKMSGERLLPD